MIFAMFGTNPYPFTRLAAALDAFAGRTGKAVEVQCGNTKYPFRHCKAISFLSHAEVLAKMSEAECLIVQGGAGSISDGMGSKKPLLVVPRVPERGESVDDQRDLVAALEKMGCLTAMFDVADIDGKLAVAMAQVRVDPPGNRIPQLIRDFLEKI